MNKTTLKSWFTRGKKPTASQFADWMDSYWHKDEKLGASAMDASFISAINAKAEQTALDTANAAIASGVSRIKDLEDVQVLKITAMERTNGCIYLSVNKDDYEVASAVASKKRLPIWAWLNNNDCDSGPEDVGTQSTTVVAGYEPVYFKIGSDSEDIPVCYKYGTDYQLMLKDIYGKSLLIDASYYLSDYVTAIGITPEKEVSDDIIPANALVIDSLTADYSATADTADNVRINSVDTAGSQFVLPLASTMTEDKNIKVYLGADSANALTIDNAGTDSSVEKGGSAECFYSAELGTWVVDVIAPVTEEEASGFNSSYTVQKQVGYQGGTGNYIKVCQMITTSSQVGNAKQSVKFDVFSEGGEHGMFVGSFFFNIQPGRSIGKFFCMNFNEDNSTGLTASDFVLQSRVTGDSIYTDLYIHATRETLSFYIGVIGSSTGLSFEWYPNIWDNTNTQKIINKQQTFVSSLPTGSQYKTYTAEEEVYQETLVSGTNIKTINGTTLLGSGDLVISGGSSSEQLLSLKPTALILVSAAVQTPVTSFTTVTSKDWTPEIDSNGFITIPTAGYLEISGFLTLEAMNGSTYSRKVIINHKDSSSNVTMISQSEVYLSSTSTDGKKKGSCPISVLIQVASNDSVQICGYSDDNTANIYATSTVILKLKS